MAVLAIVGVVLVLRSGDAPEPAPAIAAVPESTETPTQPEPEPAPDPDPDPDPDPQPDRDPELVDGLSAQQLGERFGDAVWRVEVDGCGMSATGTGFAIAPDLFVTNAHVVNIDPTPQLVSRDGDRRSATVIGLRDWPDLAVMRLDEPVDSWLDWAPTDELVEGQPVTALSYPTPLLRFSVAPGTLMSFQVQDGQRIAIASDEITDYGSSGGPLLDDAGRVTGVITEFAAGDGRQLVGLSYTYAFLGSHVDAIIAEPSPMTADCEGIGSPALPDGWEGDAVGPDPDASDYGDDPGLDALWDACEAGDMLACDDLYRYSAVGSRYEAYGDSCGDRQPTGTGNWCADGIVGSDPPAAAGGVDDYGDDAALDRLWDTCEAGDMVACDDLFRQSPPGSTYQAYGDTCGDRQPMGTGLWCVDSIAGSSG